MNGIFTTNSIVFNNFLYNQENCHQNQSGN